jgi:hypothetical protein
MGTLLREGKPVSVALTGGFHWAFWVCGTIALIGFPATATLLRRTTRPGAPAPEAAGPPDRVKEVVS